MAERLVYRRSDGKWAWQLTGDTGQVIATDGGQGYDDENYCRMMADAVIGGDYAEAVRRIRRSFPD